MYWPLYKEVLDLIEIAKCKLRRQPDARHSAEIKCITGERAKEACLLFSSFKYIYTNSTYNKISKSQLQLDKQVS